ncbi:ArsC family [uncultured Clostridium sp.]|nr:ArsC family [uncultured Clostridium sp.]
MNEKEISKGEFRSVCQAVGGIGAMINEECKDKDALALVKYISEDEREEKLLANQQVIKTPIVRNGKQATVGYEPMVWKGWS